MWALIAVWRTPLIKGVNLINSLWRNICVSRSANVINNKLQLVSGFNGLRLDCSVFMLITIQSVAVLLAT